MIRTWLDLPNPGIFASLFFLYFGIIALLWIVVFRSRISPHIATMTGVVAPFFSSVAVLFALLTGFLANDVSERSRLAVRAIQTEAGELRNVHTLSVASASDMRAIRSALKAYVKSVVDDEWPAMDKGVSSPNTLMAYDNLLREVSIPSIAKDSGAAVHNAMLSTMVRVGTARSDRLALSTDHTSDLKWLIVLILGVMTQIAIAIVHLDKPRAFIGSLTVFSTAAVIALGTIALQEYPFDGAFRISPAPIAALQSLSD